MMSVSVFACYCKSTLMLVMHLFSPSLIARGSTLALPSCSFLPSVHTWTFAAVSFLATRVMKADSYDDAKLFHLL